MPVRLSGRTCRRKRQTSAPFGRSLIADTADRQRRAGARANIDSVRLHYRESAGRVAEIQMLQVAPVVRYCSSFGCGQSNWITRRSFSFVGARCSVLVFLSFFHSERPQSSSRERERQLLGGEQSRAKESSGGNLCSRTTRSGQIK